MNLAKVSANGQITVPVEIRKILDVKEGDKVIFFERNGDVVIKNSSQLAIKEARKTFEDVNISEEEILSDVMNVRYGNKQ